MPDHGNIDPDPWDLLSGIDNHGQFLTRWEINFVADLIDRNEEYSNRYGENMELSQAQIAKIEEIYDLKVKL